MPIRVRKAVRRDVAAIARLGRALNALHGDPTRFFSAPAVRRDGFGRRPVFEVLVAERGRTVLGYALFLDAYEPAYAARGLYLCDVYVVPRVRRHGVGRALLAAVAARAARRRRTFVWWVSRGWNRPARRFYRTIGAVEERVVAHALVFDAFAALAAEGRSAGSGRALPGRRPARSSGRARRP
jgi:ribosomal protein S18 acetylase RimI-like enzyme